jgi:hypothetical protein
VGQLRRRGHGVVHRAAGQLRRVRHGRVTYERFFANWGHIAGNPYIDLINAMPKYVASRSLTETAWNATLTGPTHPARSPG